MSEEPRAARPWLAFILGFVAPGMGQLYAGKPGRAFAALLLGMFVIVPAAAEIPLLLSWSLPIALLGYLLGLGIQVLVPLDGALVARRSTPLATSPVRVFGACLLLGILGTAMFMAERLWLLPHLPLRWFGNPTGAMMPTLLIGDVMVADMRRARSRPVELGEVVIFEDPESPEKLSVKRVAGLPGDWVEVRAGRLVLNRRPLTDPEASVVGRGDWGETAGRHRYEVRLGTPCLEDWPPTQVPDGTLFLLGDNRCSSRDSRSFGFVPMAAVQGRVTGVHWSSERSFWKVRWNRIGMSLRPRDHGGAAGG